MFRNQENCEALKEPFRNQTALCCELIDWVCERKIPGDFSIDSYFTNAEILNHIHGKTDPASDRKEMRIGDKRQWYFTVTVMIPDVNSKVRIVILWKYKNDDQPCKILATNRITWEVSRVVRVYRHRWTGTETFHRDGEQQLGMGDCQLRDVQGQTRHMYLVMPAYSLLMSQSRRGRAHEWALQRLSTIGEACRTMPLENLRATLAWVIEQVTEKERPFDHVVPQLGLS